MQKIMGNFGKNALLHLTGDIIKDEELKSTLKSLDYKVERMLLWSTLCSVWSYLILIMTIGRIYASFNGVNTKLLIGSMLSMYLLMGVLVYFVWKGMRYNRSYFYFTGKTYLKYQIRKLTAQRKLISLYLLEYALLVGVAGIFFFMDIKHGFSFLFRITAPVSFITYILGFYFISNFTKQIARLELIHRQINELYIKTLPVN